MAASREKVLYFEPQPSEQTAALKTCLLYTSDAADE